MKITRLNRKDLASETKNAFPSIKSTGSSTQNTCILQVVFRIPPHFRSQNSWSAPIADLLMFLGQQLWNLNLCSIRFIRSIRCTDSFVAKIGNTEAPHDKITILSELTQHMLKNTRGNITKRQQTHTLRHTHLSFND